LDGHYLGLKDETRGDVPEKLIEPCILAGAPKNALVLDPFWRN
jgi:hypothetical protein